MEPQELIDRLVQACEEQDVLFVLWWLQLMKEEGILEIAIDGKHSWKQRSALIAIAFHPQPVSTLRGIIIRILLEKGAASVLPAGTDTGRRNWCFNECDHQTSVNWRKIAPEYDSEARHVLSLPWDEVAEWVDENLPRPPHAESLTAEGPLPTLPLQKPSPLHSSPDDPSHDSSAPSAFKGSLSDWDRYVISVLAWSEPETESISSSSLLDSTIKSSPNSADLDPTSLHTSKIRISLGSNSPATSLKRPNPSLLGTSPSTSSISLPRPEPKRPIQCIRLNLARFPHHFTDIDLQVLFLGINVEATIIHYDCKRGKTFAFIDVPATDLNWCLDEVNGMILEGQTLRCGVAYDRKETGSSRDGARSRRRRRVSGR